MRIVLWNILHGGGSKARALTIRKTLLDYDADVLVLPEFQIGHAGSALCASLQGAGYMLSHPQAAERSNTVLVASRAPITSGQTLDESVDEFWRLWLVETAGLRLLGVYMPCGRAKQPYWDAILRSATMPKNADFILGDFNTGTNDRDKSPSGDPFFCAEYMDRIAQAGYEDLWRAFHPDLREYSWFNARSGYKNGFRVDHAFSSARLRASVTSCRYDHTPRETRVSDHSAMVLELAD